MDFAHTWTAPSPCKDTWPGIPVSHKQTLLPCQHSALHTPTLSHSIHVSLSRNTDVAQPWRSCKIPAWLPEPTSTSCRRNKQPCIPPGNKAAHADRTGLPVKDTNQCPPGGSTYVLRTKLAANPARPSTSSKCRNVQEGAASSCLEGP